MSPNHIHNILYKNSCDNCRAANAAAGIESTDENTAAYWGESFRSPGERSGEHLQDYRNQSEESHMWRHKLQAHPQEEVSFSMKVVKRFLSSFEREVAESIFIEVNQNKNILNSKSGFNRCLIPKLSVMMGEKEYKEILSQDAYDESEFDQLSSDNARRGRKKKHRDSPDVLNNNISNPLPPPGKRKKYFKNKRQECTTRVDPEERREEIVGHEANALPPSTEELIRDTEVKSPVCSDGASTPPLSPTTPPPPPAATPPSASLTQSSPTPTPAPPRHNFPIFTSSKTQFKPRRKPKSKVKVLDHPKFKFQKLSTIFCPENFNYPRGPDESQVKVRRRSDDKPQLKPELSSDHIPDEDNCYSLMAKSRNLVG